MAPTKQTAKKTTGGKAQRVRLFKDPVQRTRSANTDCMQSPTCSANTAGAVKRVRSQMDPDDVCMGEHEAETGAAKRTRLQTDVGDACISEREPAGDKIHDLSKNQVNADGTAVFCSLCADGGLLYECSNCPRAVCSHCIEVPLEYLDVVSCDDVQFQCVGCYWHATLKAIAEHKEKAKHEQLALTGYIGFTRDGAPILPTFLKVIGKFELSTIAQVTTHPTLIVNLSLVSLKAVSTSALLDHCLRDYFAPNGLDIVSIPFDLGTDDKVDNWPVRVSSALDGLRPTYRHVIFVVTNHTDEDSGDLFLGKDECNKEFSASVDEFLDVLLEPFRHYLPGSVAYFLACGSIVGNKESLSLLCQTVRSFKVGHALAFDAPRLVTSHAAGLLMKLTRNVVVHHIEFMAALEHLLRDETELGKHTGLVHITPDIATRYLWTHRQIQPWGECIPVQCPVCFVVQKWVTVWLESSTYSFECINDACGWNGKKKEKERYQFLVRRPEGVELLHMKKVSGASWMKLHFSA